MGQYGMNERVRRLRQESVEAIPRISMERARLVTEAYEAYEGRVSIPVLRARTLEHILTHKALHIGRGELIVGERGPSPCETPTYPELCCHTLEDLDIMDGRAKISFKVDPASRTIQEEEIIPQWAGKSIRDHVVGLMTPEWKALYEAGVFTEFMEQRAPGHAVGDDKLYKKGFVQWKADIEAQMDRLDDLTDPEAYGKREQLKAMAICCDAIMTFGRRYGQAARDRAETTDDPQEKTDLLQVAQVCDQVPAQAPRTFHEALQMYWFVHLTVINELNTWDAFCPGKLDHHLYPFYERELEAGTLTREGAKELLECFFIKFNNQPAPPKVGITLKESGTYTDFCNINIGGLLPDGTSGVNAVSYLLLEVIEDLRILQPSNNIQVSRVNPDDFLIEAGKVIREGMGFPSVFNADAVVQELVRCGKTPADALTGGTSGCVEVGCFGKEAFILTGYLNLVKILELTLHRGLDPLTGKRIGKDTGDPTAFGSFHDLMAAFEDQLNHVVDIKIRGNQVIEQLYAKKMPAPFLSIVTDDCIQSARDYNNGGARYNTRYIQGVGIGTITDSLSAIKTHVFDQQTWDMDQVLTMIHADFEGYEKERTRLRMRTPKYGNDDNLADDIMVQVFEAFFTAVDGRPTASGGTYHIQMLPTTSHVYFGSVIGATPDGRKKYRPLSEGISPVQGVDKHGPTAVIQSAGKMDHLRTGGTLLNQRLSPDLLQGQAGLNQLKGLIRAYFAVDGHHIQFNVFDVAKLKEAQQHPDLYQNLIVRVAGYSDYFNNLNKNLQDEIIERTEQSGFGGKA